MILGLVACSTPSKKDIKTITAPSQSITVPNGSISVVFQNEQFSNQDSYFTQGLDSYFKHHTKGWSVDRDNLNAPFKLSCERVRDGFTNCSDMVLNCDLLSEKDVIKTLMRRFPSESCFDGLDEDSFQTEAFNNGQSFAQDVIEELANIENIEEIIAQKALELAFNKKGTDALIEITKNYPNTEAESKAKNEITARNKSKQLRELEKAEEKKKREELAKKEFDALKNNPEAKAYDAFAKKYADLKDYVNKAKTMALIIRQENSKKSKAESLGINLNPLPKPKNKEQVKNPKKTLSKAKTPTKPKKAVQQSTELSCYDSRNNMCGDYHFPTVAKRNDFERKCLSLGSKVLPQKCDSKGATGCYMTSDSTTTTTWIFNMNRNQVSNICRSNGGRVVTGQ